MTAREGFDIEKEAARICSESASKLNQQGHNYGLKESIVDFGRRCQDAAYEKAAKICRGYPRKMQAECADVSARIEWDILALKNP